MYVRLAVEKQILFFESEKNRIINQIYSDEMKSPDIETQNQALEKMSKLYY